MNESKINSLVDNVYVLNLKKDSFKYDILKRKLDKKNIRHQRFLGVDGYSGSISTKAREKAFRNMLDEYRETDLYEPIVRRGAHVLRAGDIGAHRTHGAMGCLLSHRKIIQDAIDNKYKKILLFQDDIYFHKKFEEMLDNLKPTIESSVMVHLGATEHTSFVKRSKWSDPDWTHKRIKYSTHERTCGLFAAVISEEMFDPFMKLSKFKLFADDQCFGFLAYNKFFGSCWAGYPNLVISHLGHSRTSSTEDKGFVMEERPMCRKVAMSKFGWDLDYYDLSERYHE